MKVSTNYLQAPGPTEATCFRVSPLARAVALALLAGAADAYSSPPVAAGVLPSGGVISSGTGTVGQAGSAMVINQASQNLAINWQSFNVGSGASVRFDQPNSSAIALNRVLGNDGSQILGSLSANGRVFVLNPNGILFGRDARVNVGGLVASTLGLSDADFNAGKRTFQGNGGSIVNYGTINAAAGGYVALLGGQVSNQGTINAQLGSVALGSGNKVTLDFAGDKLMSLTVDEAALNALVENKQLIRADGGTVILSARAANAVLDTVVNNEGVIEARTVENQNGVIKLLGGMEGGTVKVGGTLNASAPNGGDGGFVETSGAHVKVASDAIVTTSAPQGRTGEWLIDPADYTIAASGGDITGTTLGNSLNGTSVTIASSSGTVNTSGNGDIFVNDAVTWSANNQLTLSAQRNILINSPITAAGNTGKVALQVGLAVPNAGNTADYSFGANGKINLKSPSNNTNFSLKVGSDGTTTTYRVITTLGAPGSTTGNDLQGMRGSTANLNRNYALGADIDASATSGWNGGSGFNPVGSGSGAYNGNFHGLGHTVTNLTINRPNATFVGLFGWTTSTIRDVGLAGGTITGNSTVGGLVGESDGLLQNAYSTATVNSDGVSIGGLVGVNYGTVTGSHASGSVTGTFSYDVGGLAGYNGGTIVNSYSGGAVHGYNNTGGLVGTNGGTITASYSTANVLADNNAAGGLVGFNGSAGVITNTRAEGSVTVPSDPGTNPYYAGGLVGENEGTISDSHAIGNINAQSGIGGFAGRNAGALTNVYSTGMVSDGYQVGGLVGFNEASGTISNSYSTSIVGGPNATDVGGLVGLNHGSISSSHASGQVTGDVDVGGLVGFNDSTGSITGSYATGEIIGGNNTFGGLVGETYGTVTSSYASGNVSGYSTGGGLAGHNGGTMTDVYATGSVTANDTVGGLVGANDGSITNAYATGVLDGSYTIGGLVGYNGLNSSLASISRSYRTVAVDNPNGSGVGGLVGVNAGIIVESYSTAPVTGFFFAGGLAGENFGTVSNSFATGSVQGFKWIGGLVGSNAGTLDTVFATGPVIGDGGNAGGLAGTSEAGGSITNSYATGSVATSDNPYTINAYYTGGLVGNNGGSITNSYARGDVSGLNAIGGLVGQNTGSVSNSYATGAVVSPGGYVGALVGDNPGTITNSFWNSQTSGQGTNGIGQNDGTSTGTMGATTAQLQQSATQSFYPANASAWDFANTWYAGGGAYPILRTSPFVLTLSYSGSHQTYGAVNLASAATISNLWYADTASIVTGLNVSSTATSTSSVGAYAISGTGAGATSTTGMPYSFIYVPGTLTIDPAALAVAANAQSKIYGQVDPALNYSLTGLVNGDSASVLSGALARAAGVNVGTYAINLGSLVSNPNYLLSFTGNNLSITPKALSYTIAASDKVYDGNTSASVVLSGLAGFVGSETVSLSGASGAFNSKDVATANTVTVTGGTLLDGANGGLASNYTVAGGTATAHITPYTVNLAGSSTYDGTTAVGANRFTVGTLVSGESLALTGSGTLADKNVGVNKAVGVGTLALADATGLASNYTLTGGTRTATITAKSITGITGITAANKVYDGSAGATIATGSAAFTGKIGGDVLGVASGTGTFNGANGKNVGNSKTVNITGLSLNGADATNYVLTSSTATTTANITPFVVNLTGNRAYNGTTTLANSIFTLGTLVGSETLTLTGNGTMADKNAGTGKSVTLNTIALGNGTNGGLASNYTLTGGTRVANISKAVVTLTGSRSYDGTTSVAAGIFGLGGLVGSETLNLTGSGTITSKNVGNNKTVTVDSLALADGANGGVASNYTLTGGTKVANVSKANLTLSTSNVTKTYDGGTSASGAAVVTAGQLFSTDSVSGGTFAFTNKNAGTGNKTVTASGVTVSDGNSGGNYNVTYASNTASTINQANLTLSTSNVTKTYDGTTSASGTATVTGGTLFPGDTLTGGSFAFTDKNAGAGNKTVTASGVTVSDGNNGGNYNVTYASNTASTINQANLTLSTGDVTKTYDGTTSASGTATVTSGTLFSTDSISGGSFAFTDKNAGTGNKTVTASGISVSDGNSGGNYNVSYASNTHSTINQAGLTVGTTDVIKTYDGTTSAIGTVAVVGGTLFSGDNLTGGTFAFTDKNAGTGNKTVTTSAVTVGDGTNNGNYNVIYSNNTHSTINQANLTLSTSNVTKTYDGTTSASGTATVTGGTLFSGDTLAGGTFAFTDKNAGIGNKSVTTTGVTVGDGTNNANYGVSYANNNASTINQASLTVSTINVAKTYDGTTSATGTPTVTAGTLFSGDTLTGGTFAFADRNAGTNKTVNISGVTAGDGVNNGNYAVRYASNNSSTIDRANLALTTSGVTKTYDANLSANGTPVVAGGTLFSGDTLAGGSYAFTDKNAGSGNKSVTAGAITVIDGNGGGNYAVTYVNNTSSTISPAPILVAADNKSKTYADANPALTASVTGLQGGESSALVTGLATAALPESGVGTYAIDASRASAGANYAVTTTVNGVMTVVPAHLTIIADDKSRIQGVPNPPFTASITGYKLGQNRNVLGGSLAFDTLATPGSLFGSYSISASGATASNYTIRYVDGVLRITPALTEPSAAGAPSNGYNGTVGNLRNRHMTALPGEPGGGTQILGAQQVLNLPLSISGDGVLLPAGIGAN